MGDSTIHNGRCLNCKEELRSVDKYCASCGVKATYHNLSLKYLLTSFFESFLNIEYKILRSFRDIWTPNKITNYYLSGQKDQYVHPFRLLFICLVIFFGLAAYSLKESDLGNPYEEIYNIAANKTISQLDTLKEDFQLAEEQLLIDSLKVLLSTGGKSYDNVNINAFGVNLKDYGIKKSDVFLKSEEEVIAQFPKDLTMFEYLIAKQQIKVIKNNTGALTFIVGNMLWGIILLTLVMAWVLKGLYIRHSSYYAEHVVQLTNFHSVALVVITIYSIGNYFYGEAIPYVSFVILLYLIWYWIYGFSRFYSQGILMTICKSFVFLIVYIVILSMIALMILLLSLLFF